MAGLESLRGDLMAVAGVQSIEPLAMLPGARCRLYLEALLASQANPVLAVDARGVVVVANAAAVAASGLPEQNLIGLSLRELLHDTTLVDALLAHDYRLPVSEVQIAGQSFLLETLALHVDSGSVAGAMLTLHAPQRIGERLSALQNYSAGGFESMLGQSPAIRELEARAARMAQVDAPLISSNLFFRLSCIKRARLMGASCIAPPQTGQTIC